MSGICTAIASARHGAKTALIQDRPVLGGNASSEIRMHVCGASCGGEKQNVRETGIIEEILLENRFRNPAKSFHVLDTILWEKVNFQHNLDLYLNTVVLDCDVEDNIIKSISARQLTTEKWFLFTGRIFIDSTGDGFLAYASGAQYNVGREGKSDFNESHAPQKKDNITLGSTLMFKAVNLGYPVHFKKPGWAYTFTEEDLKNRKHCTYEDNMEYYNIDSGFWWIEVGGDGKLDTILDGEKIRDELLKVLYGVWDHIKNRGDHGADNYALDWVQFLPGKRESRRILGDYVLCEEDVLSNRIFEDAVAYGGWPMDIHAPGGIWNKEAYPTNFIKFDGVYTIPYRCYYSKNVKNLMMAGRNISATHMAFGSTRVMATCAVGGQAVGTAASMAIKKGCMPKGILPYVSELQQNLLKDDCYIPGYKNTAKADAARYAKVNASSTEKGFKAEDVTNGIARTEKTGKNCWMSKMASWIELEFKEKVEISEIHIKFDSNLSNERQLQISIDKNIHDIPFKGLPAELARDYDIEFYPGSSRINECDKPDRVIEVRDNYLRFCKHVLEQKICAGRMRVRILNTHGSPRASVYEIRVYSS